MSKRKVRSRSSARKATRKKVSRKAARKTTPRKAVRKKIIKAPDNLIYGAALERATMWSPEAAKKAAAIGVVPAEAVRKQANNVSPRYAYEYDLDIFRRFGPVAFDTLRGMRKIRHFHCFSTEGVKAFTTLGEVDKHVNDSPKPENQMRVEMLSGASSARLAWYVSVEDGVVTWKYREKVEPGWLRR